jgi:Tol biopolymer transport system component
MTNKSNKQTVATLICTVLVATISVVSAFIARAKLKTHVYREVPDVDSVVLSDYFTVYKGNYWVYEGVATNVTEGSNFGFRRFFMSTSRSHRPSDLTLGRKDSTVLRTDQLTESQLGKVAYILAGDIYVRPLPTGRPTRLTTDGYNDLPRWSASGQWLAFLKKERQVWVQRSDGGASRPVDSETVTKSFAWAPVTDRLAYTTRDGRLQIMDTVSASRITLVPTIAPPQSTGTVDSFAWCPNEDWIAYEWTQTKPDQSLNYQGLWKVSVDGRNRMEVYESGAPRRGPALLAGWSPTGDDILFWQHEILSASLLSDGAQLYGVSASPDSEATKPIRLGTGQTLLHLDFVVPAPPESSSGRANMVALIVGEGRETWTTKRLELSGKPVTADTMTAISPVWSPDGKQIAYVAMRDSGSPLRGGEPLRRILRQRRIWIAEVFGPSQSRQVTHNPGYRDERPQFSADGAHILFARIDLQNRVSLWLVPSEGGEPQQVVAEFSPPDNWFGYYGYIDWSQFAWWRR